MEDKSKFRYVDTSIATVKMTGGVPFNADEMYSSDENIDEVDNALLRHRTSDVIDADISSRFKIENNNDHAATKSHSQESNGTVYNKGLHTNLKLVHRPNSNSDMYSKSENPNLTQGSENDENADETQGKTYNGISGNIKELPLKYSNSNLKDLSKSKNKILQDNSNTKPVSKSGSSLETKKYINDIDKVKHSGVTNHPIYIPPRDYYKKSNGLPRQGSSSPLESSISSRESSISPRQHSQLPRPSSSLENLKINTRKGSEHGMVSSSSLSAISDAHHGDRLRTPRVNPFNMALLVDEDHFSDTVENYFRTQRHSVDYAMLPSVSHGGEWEFDKSQVSFAELGLSEDHFSHPQGHFGLSGIEELELAIENCKELIRKASQDSDKQKNLVLKLVQLRIKLQELKEGPEPVPDNVKVILSHKMMQKVSRTGKYYCERCNGSIWSMLQVWYRCTECGYRCHEKCLQQILRPCAKAKVIENPTLIFDICPKDPKGLASQNFRCGECRSTISFRAGHSEPRLCDYTGLYFCEFCHWNDMFIIPARVVHNWDFTPHKVCRASKQFLKLIQKKAVIEIQHVNPMLFAHVDQLNEIRKLREEMMKMKKYILTCANAMSAKLLLLLENRQHFVESSDRYSMQDFLDAEDVLLPELVNIHSTWAQHIKVDCELCQGRGFCCELCEVKEVLFPFDNIAVVCPKCSYVLHRHCFARKGACPRCERREKRETDKS